MKKLLQNVYLALTTCERRFFEVFSFLVYRPQARVISVGNLSMGGTGKTPVLFEIIEELRQSHNVCVLSRGYRSPWERSFYHLQGKGSHPDGLTDEALLLNRRFPQIPVLLGKNRHHAAIVGEQRVKPDIFLLDDGFQYRRLRKDVELLLWDAMSDPTEAQLLPAGRLREPLSRLRDAQAVLLTRCESVSEDKIAFWKKWLSEKAPGVPVIMVQTRCYGLFDCHDNRLPLVESQAEFMAFSAIGRPESFYAQLEQIGCRIGDRVEFRDHHRFSDSELVELGRKATEKKLRPVCTEKDFCKISPEIAEKLNISVLKIRTLPVSQRSFTAELAAVGILLPAATASGGG
ncbi:MAG: tetraacyldisaccharide 4'-kinase [Candidatus Riflebacteria bacterium HGW-Riflebacteria-2]|jgi:tetraacyldisaccharide 4'-kinase|nr:MAG: tetraacyldisaccharide 4'-kinase [Candidatus Riflebacteria bacterium HGW-Riflebacteria-2]